MKKKAAIAVLAMLLAGLASNLLYEQNQSHVTAQYDETVAQMEQEALELEQQQLQGDLPQGPSVWETEYRKAILVCLAVYLPLTTVVVLVLLGLRKKQSGGKPPDPPSDGGPENQNQQH